MCEGLDVTNCEDLICLISFKEIEKRVRKDVHKCIFISLSFGVVEIIKMYFRNVDFVEEKQISKIFVIPNLLHQMALFALFNDGKPLMYSVKVFHLELVPLLTHTPGFDLTA